MSLYLVWPCLHLMFWWPLWGRGFLRGRVEGQRRCSGLQPASLQMLVSKPFKRPKNKVEIKPSGLFTASLTTHEHTHGCRCTEGRAPCPTPSTFLVDFLLKAVALLCGCASPALLPLGDFFFFRDWPMSVRRRRRRPHVSLMPRYSTNRRLFPCTAPLTSVVFYCHLPVKEHIGRVRL